LVTPRPAVRRVADAPALAGVQATSGLRHPGADRRVLAPPVDVAQIAAAAVLAHHGAVEPTDDLRRKDLEPRQQIRFMGFGGEEEGLVGSTYYTEHLTPTQASKIMVMIDTDMISSPNFARFVYDGDGSDPGNPAGPPGVR
jgi:Zn-dependent M28 family amino/carboxypeptidase